MTRPLIGISLDSQHEQTFSTYPWYALRTNYFQAIQDCGGIPVGIPHEAAAIPAYLERLDGLVISGGQSDIPPHFYGEQTIHPKTRLNESRARFEHALAKAALAVEMPILGICGGHQLLNVALGGTLIQYIPEEVPGAINHRRDAQRHLPSHTITIAPGSHLASLAPEAQVMVNSSHQQALKDLGRGLIASAHTEDGVIEAIELPAHPFAVGVQWHPEFFVSPLDRTLLEAFVAASQKRRAHG